MAELTSVRRQPLRSESFPEDARPVHPLPTPPALVGTLSLRKRLCQSKVGQSKVGQSKVGQSKVGQSKVGQSKVGQSKVRDPSNPAVIG